HKLLLLEELFLRLAMIGIIHAAIYRTNGSALRLVMKTNTLGALVRNNVIDVHTHRFLSFVGFVGIAHRRGEYSVQRSSVRKSPFFSAFVYRVIRTFGFAGPAIDTLVRNDYRHNSKNQLGLF